MSSRSIPEVPRLENPCQAMSRIGRPRRPTGPGLGLRSNGAPSLLLTLAVLLLGASPDLWAQDWKGRGRVHGKVVDSEQNPIAGATVHLLFRGQEGVGPEPIRTKKNGRWAYMGLSTAPYTVRIEAEGFLGSEGEVRVNEYGGATQPVEVVLRKAEEGVESAAGASLMALVEEGNRLLADGQFAAARGTFEEVHGQLEDSKQKAQLERAIAGTYLEEGETREARRRFEALLLGAEDAAARADILRALARCHYVDGDIDASVGHLREALEAVPDDVPSLRLIADILVGTGREKEAEPYLERLPQGESLDPNALLNLGITAYNEGDMDTALEKFQKVAESYPDNASAHFYLGLVRMGKAQNAEAIEHLEKMLELEPGHASAGEAQQFLTYLKEQ